MREQFEKLPEIAKKLRMCEWSYSEQFKCYLVEDPCSGFINGAWYYFQEAHKELLEQKKKIDEIKDLMDADVYHIPTLIKELKELLK